MPKKEEKQPVSFLLKKDEKAQPPEYNPTEIEYLGKYKAKLVRAKDERDRQHPELDMMTYLEYWDSNEKLANTFVGKRTTKSETNFQSGTIRQKIWAFTSAVNKMNLSASFMAFDHTETLLNSLGIGMTDILRKTEELDMDEEKRLIRLYEMMKQGTVFVQEQWKKCFRPKKTLNQLFRGQVKGVTWQTQLKEYLSIPSRDVLWAPGVYLGSMKKYFIKEQPFIYTVDVKPYVEVASMFQNWERWKYVPRNLVSQLGDMLPNSTVQAFFSITDIERDQVEIVRYEDPWNNEFQISLNGVMMLPVGFPLSEITPDGDYSITNQVFEIIHSKFALGKSLPMKLRNKTAVYDELVKSSVLLTQQKFAPPMANKTGKHLSPKIFFPGKITNGIDPEKLKVLNEKFAQGIGQGEIAMMELFRQEMDNDSVNKTFQGQNAKNGDTATEILTVQEQSAMIIGQSIFVSGLLEKKLADLRLPNLLKNWFTPIEKTIDMVKGVLNKYRTVNIQAQIPGKGMGRSMIVPTDTPPDAQSIYNEEEASPIPMRKIYLVPELLKMAKLTWQTIVNPTDKRSSNTSKLMFRAMLADAAAYFGQDLNIDYLEERFAETWEENSAKLFMKQPKPVEPVAAQPGQNNQQPGGVNGGKVATPGAPNLQPAGNNVKTI